MSKITINGWDRRSWTLSIIVSLLILVMLWLVYFYQEDAHEIRVITIDNPNTLSVRNFSKDYEFVNHNDSKTAIVVQNEDLVAINSVMIPASSIKADHWNVMLKDSSKLYINNTLKAITIINSGTFQQLFNLSEQELRELSFIELAFYNVQVEKFLEKLSVVNDKAIILVEGSDLLPIQRMIANLFHAKIFFIKYDKETLDILSDKNSDIDNLWIEFVDSGIVSPLPKLKNVNALSLVSYNRSLPTDILKNNPSIKGIYIWTDSGSIDLAKTKLRHLSFRSNDRLTIGKFQEKKMDYFSGIIDDQRIIELSKMKRLEWLTASVEDLDQLQFEGMIKAVPKIKVLNLVLPDKKFSLQSLEQLPELKALIITSSDSLDIKSIEHLKTLKYLSLNLNKEEDDKIYDQLRIALPGTVVVRHDGPCMGSGYLLLIPLISIAIYFFRRFNFGK